MDKILKGIWKAFVHWNGVFWGMGILIFLIDRLDAFIARRAGTRRQFDVIEMATDSNGLSPAFAGIVLIMIIIPMIVLIIDRGLDRRCVECKQWFALRVTDDTLIKREDIQILTEVKRKDNYGHVVGTQEQYVPGTRKIYHKNYICRKCGATSFRTYSKDEKNT